MKPTFKGSLMFPSQYVAAEDLKGRDVAVTIAGVEKTKLRTNDGKMEDKFLIRFKGKDKPLVLNSTNAKMIASLHGPAADKWTGKRITIYPTTCSAFGKQTTCIRVRDRSPDDETKPVDGFPDNGDSDSGSPEVDHQCPDCGRVEVAEVGSRPQCTCGATMVEGGA